MKGKIFAFGITGLGFALAPSSMALPASKEIGGVATAKSIAQTTAHAPEQLDDFILPNVVIDGLDLTAALETLKTAYEDVCHKTGDTPLALTFDVAPGNTEKARINLPQEGFGASVKLLASIAGMSVDREGLKYHFAPLEGDARITKTLSVPPDFANGLQENTLAPAEKTKSVDRLLSELGLLADPDAKIKLKPSGELVMSDIREADAHAIGNFTKVLSTMTPKQLKFSAKAIELKADDKIEVPTHLLTENEVSQLMQKISMIKGADLLTSPTVTCRMGKPTCIEIVRDFPDSKKAAKNTDFPKNKAVVGAKVGDQELEANEQPVATPPKPNQVGWTLRAMGDRVGLKLEVKLHHWDRVGSIDPDTKRVSIRNRTEIADEGIYVDRATKVLSQSHADGTLTLLLVKAEIIDATGRPYRDAH